MDCLYTDMLKSNKNDWFDDWRKKRDAKNSYKRLMDNNSTPVGNRHLSVLWECRNLEGSYNQLGLGLSINYTKRQFEIKSCGPKGQVGLTTLTINKCKNL